MVFESIPEAFGEMFFDSPDTGDGSYEVASVSDPFHPIDYPEADDYRNPQAYLRSLRDTIKEDISAMKKDAASVPSLRGWIKEYERVLQQVNAELRLGDEADIRAAYNKVAGFRSRFLVA